MKLKIIALSTLLSFFLANVFAQEDKGISNEDGEKKSPHLIGLAAGTTSGIGIAYTYKPNQFSIQGVVFPNIQQDEAFLQAGLNFKYDIKNYKGFDLFVFQNNRLFYTKSTFEDYDYDERGVLTLIGEVTEETLTFAHGTGLGVNVEIHDRFGFNIMTGYGLYNYSALTLTMDCGLYFRL